MININFFLLQHPLKNFSWHSIICFPYVNEYRVGYASSRNEFPSISMNITPVVVAWKCWNKILVWRKLEKVKDLENFILVSPFYHPNIPHSAYCVSDNYTLLWSLDNDFPLDDVLGQQISIAEITLFLKQIQKIKIKNIWHLIDPSPMRTSIVSVAPSFLWLPLLGLHSRKTKSTTKRNLNKDNSTFLREE